MAYISISNPAFPTRPRQRSKWGCLTCRKRRKKCNERRPRCADCSRHSLNCTWPDQGSARISVTVASIESSPPKGSSPSGWKKRHDTSHPLSLVVPPNTRPCGLKSTLEQALFHHFIQDFLPLLVHPEAHPGFSDLHELYATGLQHPWIMETFLAMASLHISQISNSLDTVAYNYYNTAIGVVRRKIESGDVEGTEDWLLASTVFFYLFEVGLRHTRINSELRVDLIIITGMERQRLKQPNAPPRSSGPALQAAPSKRIFSRVLINNTSIPPRRRGIISLSRRNHVSLARRSQPPLRQILLGRPRIRPQLCPIP